MSKANANPEECFAAFLPGLHISIIQKLLHRFLKSIFLVWLALALTVCSELWNTTLLFPFGLFSLAGKVDLSALWFAGFLLLLIRILIGWRPSIKEQQHLLCCWFQELCWLHRNLKARCSFGSKLQMLRLQWEEKWKLWAWIEIWFWWDSLKC